MRHRRAFEPDPLIKISLESNVLLVYFFTDRTDMTLVGPLRKLDTIIYIPNSRVPRYTLKVT